MIGYLIMGFFVYLMVRFITGFIIPVVKTTRNLRKQFSGMREATEKNDDQAVSKSNNNTPKYDLGGEYIAFEEVKETPKP